jgi:hypothetical protein
MHENNTSSAVGVMPRAAALGRFFASGNPGFEQPAAA